jgi:hypothetical protein
VGLRDGISVGKRALVLKVNTVTHWLDGIGNLKIGSFIIVAMYLVTSVSCWRLARKLSVERINTSKEYHAWRAVAVSLLVLSIIKLLDLQTALTEAGRNLALSEGWYAHRQVVQLVFIVFITISGIAAVIVLLIRARKASLSTLLALIGTGFVVAFVIIRAVSFHSVDQFIAKRTLGLSWNWILETSGISLVFVTSQLRSYRRT